MDHAKHAARAVQYRKTAQYRERYSAWYAKNRQKRWDYNKEWIKNHPEVMILQRARRRAKQKGLLCTITLKDIKIPLRCPVLGILLERQGTKNRAAAPSLDRLRPHLGYVPGNVCVISYKANTIKNNATLEELEKVTAWVRRGNSHERDDNNGR